MKFFVCNFRVVCSAGILVSVITTPLVDSLESYRRLACVGIQEFTVGDPVVVAAVGSERGFDRLMQIIALCFYGRALEAGRRIQETPLTQAVILIAVILSDDIPIEVERISASLAHHVSDDTRSDTVGIAIAFQVRPNLRRGVSGDSACGF